MVFNKCPTLGEEPFCVWKSLEILDFFLFGWYTTCQYILHTYQFSHVSKNRLGQNSLKKKGKSPQKEESTPGKHSKNSNKPYNKILTQEEISVLSKGGNFALMPRHIPKNAIMANLDSSILTLQGTNDREIRNETASILQKANPPKGNLKKKEIKALNKKS